MILANERNRALPEGFDLRECYRIERVLGVGGFAITYLACHAGLDHKVAIKEYLPRGIATRVEDGATVRSTSGEEEAFRWGLARFTEEARTLAEFKHPGIVPVADIFERNGTCYIVMEYLRGESLARLLARKGTLAERALRTIFDPILGALDEVHSHGVLHRDIKPENIHVLRDGGAVLLDFGSSRKARDEKAESLTVVVTPGYAPNEQYSSQGKQGPWTDIYALGATLYRTVTGSAPPEAPDRALKDEYLPVATAAKRKYRPKLLAAIDQALAIRPEDRPQSVSAFWDILEGPRENHETVLPARRLEKAAPTGKPNRPSHPTPGRWRGALAAAGLVSMAGAVLLGWTVYQQAEDRKIAAELVKRQAIEQARRESEQARWRKAAEEARRKAAEQARRKAAAEARRKAVEKARRKAAEGVRRKAVEEARRRAARKPRNSSRPKNQNDLMSGIRGLFEKLLPR